MSGPTTFQADFPLLPFSACLNLPFSLGHVNTSPSVRQGREEGPLNSGLGTEQPFAASLLT